MATPLRAVPLVLLLLATPASGAWEELRRNNDVRLLIDPQSIKTDGDAVTFRYLVDFREAQTDNKATFFRSLVNHAAVRCKERTIAVRGSEGYAGNTGRGTLLGATTPTAAEAAFKGLEKGTSDEDLWKRVCTKPAAKPDAKPTEKSAAKPAAKK
jgi:hypothetical protein